MSIEEGYLLLVTADPAIDEQIHSYLEQVGYTVTLAEDSERALAMLRSHKFDLMLLALDPPELNGMRLLQSLHNASDMEHIAVITLGQIEHMSYLEQCLAIGAQDYVNLPLNQEVLRRRVQACLRSRHFYNQNQEQMQSEQAHLAKVQRELQIAWEIQCGFLPKELPSLPGWEIAPPYYNPARAVGGDLYDVFPMTQEGFVGLIIGDVCDKGVGAALFMTLFRSFFRAAAQQRYPLAWSSPDIPFTAPPTSETDKQARFLSIGTIALKSAFELANNYVFHNHSESSYFVTMFFGVLDPETGRLLYINGGHMPAYVVGTDGIKACLKATGPVVALFPDAVFCIEQIQLDPGDVLFTYSDGVTDARNSDRQFFGASRLRELLNLPVPSATALVNRVIESVSIHIATAEQYDDITILAVQRLAESGITSTSIV